MTRYECDCRKCTYVYIRGDSETWCKATVDGVKGLRISDNTAGTKEDPDIISCPFYTTEPRQLEMYPGKG